MSFIKRTVRAWRSIMTIPAEAETVTAVFLTELAGTW